jgi:hypothetical protein
MARDVEFNVTASDKTDAALAKAEANFRRSQEKIKRESEKAGKDQDAEIGKRLGRFAKLVEAVSPKLAASLAKSLASAADVAGPLLVVGLAAAVAIGAPLIGATVSAAIIGAAGLGGVVGGLLLAAKDARVKTAADEMGKRLNERLTLAGESFVQPAIDGIHTIEKAIDSIDLEQILGDSAKFVGPLAQSIATAVTDIGNGLEDLVHNAGPEIDAIANGIVTIGKAVGDGLESLSDNGDDAAEALKLLFLIIGSGVDSVFLCVNALTELFGIIEKTGGLGVFGILADQQDGASKSARELGEAATDTAKALVGIGTSSTGAANGLQSLSEHLADVTGTARSLFGATTSVGEAIDRVTEAAKKNGKTLDAGTEKGRANREALSNLATALQAQYDATVAVNGLGPVSDKVASDNRASFIRLATSLGASKKEAEELANKILGIPTKHDTKIHADPEPAVTAARRAAAAINDIPLSKTVNITVHYRGDGSNQNSPSIGGGGGRQFAASDYWLARDDNGGSSRTGGPVQVSNNLSVSVTPDLSGIRAAWRADIRESEKRQAHKRQVAAR